MALSVVGCGYNDFGTPPLPDDPASPANLLIATLRERCADGPVSFTGSDAVLAGYVTTTDRTNNFFRTLLVEDNTGAAEVCIGLYDLHNDYPIGSRLLLQGDGLTAALDDGLLRIGLCGSSAAEPVVAMESRVVVEKYLSRTSEKIVPTPLTIPLSGLREDRIGRLVRIEGLRLDTPSDTTWAVPAALSADGTPRSAMLKFRRGADSVYVYTSGYASFAGRRVPHSPVSVTGILLQGKAGSRKVYELKMRDLYDVEVD